MSAGSSLCSWELESLAKFVFSQILWIGTLLKKKEHTCSISCVSLFCIFRQFYIIKWMILPQMCGVFFMSSVGFSQSNISAVVLLISRISATFGQTDKWSLISFARFASVQARSIWTVTCVLFYTMAMALRQKKRWRQCKKLRGVLLFRNCSHFKREQPSAPGCKLSLYVHKGVCWWQTLIVILLPLPQASWIARCPAGFSSLQSKEIQSLMETHDLKKHLFLCQLNPLVSKLITDNCNKDYISLWCV